MSRYNDYDDYDDYSDDYDDEYDDYGSSAPVKKQPVQPAKKPATNNTNNNNNNKQQQAKAPNNNNNNKQQQPQQNTNTNNKNNNQQPKTKIPTTSTTLQQQPLQQQSSSKVVTAQDLCPSTWITEKNTMLSSLWTEQNRSTVRSIHLLMLGHVDSGKSSLLGRLLLNTGRVKQSQLDSLQKEANAIGKGSFALAWLCDAQSAERERGITVDISSKWFKASKNRLCYIWDCPGHRDFVANMLSAANHAKSCILLISARTGEFESGIQGGQTYEHALLAFGCGVRDIVVAVNKCDQINFDLERYLFVCRETKKMLANIGYDVDPKHNKIRFVPISAKNDINIGQSTTNTTLPDELSSWYGTNNPTLLDLINTLPCDDYNIDKTSTSTITNSEKDQEKNNDAFVPIPTIGPNPNPLSIAIHETYVDQINGLCVTGKVLNGACIVKEKIVLIPSGLVAVIRGIECNETLVQGCFAGDVVTLQIKLLNNNEDINNAMSTIFVTEPLTQPVFGKKIIAQISTQMTLSALPMLPGQSLMIHTQHIYSIGRISKILYTKSLKSGDEHNNTTTSSKKMIANNSMSIIELTLDTPLPLIYVNSFKNSIVSQKESHNSNENNKNNDKPIDRICIRRDNETVATGVVIDCIEQQYYDFIA